jgi:carbon monoxide dehydrogenase subunit G
MQFSESKVIPAMPDQVFGALNDPDVLQACIPGCKSLEQQSKNDFAACIVLKIGAMPAKFFCTVKTSDLVFPTSYKISGEGKAGMAGSAKGIATVSLSSDPAGTLLKYEVNTELEGMLKKFGKGLLDKLARDMSAKFFENLTDQLSISDAQMH